MFARKPLALVTLGARFNDDPAAGNPPAITLDAIVGNAELMAQLLQHDSVKSHAANLAKTDIEKLSGNNKELLDQLTAARGKSKQYDDLIARIQGTSEEDDLKNGKITARQLIDKHVEAARSSWQKDYDSLGNEKKTLEEQLTQLKAQIQQSKLNDVIGQAAVSNEAFNKKALKHFLSAASGVWKLEENGSFVARDGNGNVMMGKNGQPITPQDWLAGLPQNEEFSHYFTFPNGAGANPGSSAAAGTMTRAQYQEEVSKEKDPVKRKELINKALTGVLKIVG